ncbi:FTR1 family protein [Paenibacillus sp. CC-CFT747]|nr:FTR1 family protein [Paenibacillus sp. CC-CFT747]
MIGGYTGLFAAVMLIYMSYWLHSKASLASWKQYIHSKGTNALAAGSLWSIAILAFLAVFREGTETVLFFIGMASSISTASLLGGIAIGAALLSVIAALILKAGVRIPMRPFFSCRACWCSTCASSFSAWASTGFSSRRCCRPAIRRQCLRLSSWACTPLGRI